MEQDRIDGLVGQANEERETLLEMRQYLHQNYGIYFKDKKLYSLRNKLNRRIRCLPSVTSLKSYKKHLEENPDEIPHFLDEMSTNKTAFFREPRHWDFLVEEVIPRWKRGSSSVKAWTAACSTGEEPYTLAMLLDDHLRYGTKGKEMSFKILASDISRNALSRTNKGVYKAERVQQVSDYNPRYAKNYFDSAGDSFKVKDCLIETLTLRFFNLTEESYPFRNNFELILCRNVLIYFEDDLIEQIVNQLGKSLKPGGYLFVGHTESLHDISHDLEKIQPAIFRKSGARNGY